MNKKILEVCLPVHNEEEILDEFTESLYNWFNNSRVVNEFENFIIHFLNNGSVDKSSEKLKRIKDQYPNVKITSFVKNYGFHTSTSYLLYKSTGDIVVLIPSDNQVPLESVEIAIIETLKTNNSSFLVRKNNYEDSKLMGVFKKNFYKIMRKISYGSIDGFFGMGVYTFQSLSVIKKSQYTPFHIRLVIPYVVDSFNIIGFNELKRKAGKTSFGIINYFIESFKLILSSQKFPTYLSVGLVSFFSISTFLSLPLIIILKILLPASIHPGFATIIILLLLMMSIQGILTLLILLEIKSRDGISGLSILRRKRPIIIKNN
tara:strand:- start:1357 stop:2310 length:954 start_codon:yes stop_codon:yes gene_type:complete